MRWFVIPFLLSPSLALAQQAAPPPSATFAGQLATMLSQAVDERDAAVKQVADLQKQLADAKAKPQEPK